MSTLSSARGQLYSTFCFLYIYFLFFETSKMCRNEDNDKLFSLKTIRTTATDNTKLVAILRSYTYCFPPTLTEAGLPHETLISCVFRAIRTTTQRCSRLRAPIEVVASWLSFLSHTWELDHTWLSYTPVLHVGNLLKTSSRRNRLTKLSTNTEYVKVESANVNI